MHRKENFKVILFVLWSANISPGRGFSGNEKLF
jgi:hypothetical protein